MQRSEKHSDWIERYQSDQKKVSLEKKTARRSRNKVLKLSYKM